MTVKLIGGRAAAKGEIEALELFIGQKLDTEFMELVSTSDGANLESNSFSVNNIENMGSINYLIPIDSIIEHRNNLKLSFRAEYPIAVAAGGNYVLLNQERGGAIYFYDHEIEGGIYLVAGSLNEFLEKLSPFNDVAIQMRPDQVKSVWIDPTFIKDLDRY